MSRNIQRFYFFNYTADDPEETNSSEGGVLVFNTYQNQNEIDQDLPNAPSSVRLASNNLSNNSNHNNDCDYSVSYDLSDAAVMQNLRNTNFPFTIPLGFAFWNPSPGILNEFNNKILFDYPQIP